jgi:phosphatidylserine decarboxylase
VIASPAGRYLGLSAGLLALGFILWGFDLLPRTYETFALLFAGSLGIAALFVFFRDPDRTPQGEIVSAADGKVRAVDSDGVALRISVFMNVTDVHVNRFPLDGVVDRIDDLGQGFRPAYQEDSRHNVRRHYHLTTALGGVEVIQMTGIVARRLVSYVKPGDVGRKGDRFGMIALGSRVDILFPVGRAEALVKVGDRVRAGETPIARGRP